METPVPKALLQGDFSFDVEVIPTIPADEKEQGERAVMLFQSGLADRETAMSIAGVSNPDVVAEKINTEIQASDLAMRVEKVRLGLELGVDTKVLARELGFEDSDLIEPTSSPDNEEITTDFGTFGEEEPSEDITVIETINKTDS